MGRVCGPEGVVTPVNSLVHGAVNRVFERASTRGVAVLRIVAATNSGVLALDDLAATMYPPSSGVSQRVARASLSRTLRRLWKAGLIELYDARSSLSQHFCAAQRKLAESEADPEAAYRRALELLGDEFFHYESVAEFLETQRHRLNDVPRGFYVKHVQITEPGQAASGEGTHRS